MARLILRRLPLESFLRGLDRKRFINNIYQSLSNSGHQIKYSAFSSGLAVIKWHQGNWHGAADPRREGKALSLLEKNNP